MLMPAPMKKISITVLRADVRDVTRALGELGVVQLTSATRESRELKPADVEECDESCEELLSHLQNLMEDLDIEPPDELPDAGAFRMPLEEAGTTLNEAEEVVSPLMDQARELDQALAHYSETRQKLHPLRGIDVPFRKLREHRFFHLEFGSLPMEELAVVKDELPRAAVAVSLAPERRSQAESGELSLLVMSSRRDRFALQTVLEESSFEKGEIPEDYTGIASKLYEQVDKEYRDAEKERRHLASRLRRVAEEYEDRLKAAYQRLLVEERLHRAEQSFGATWATVVITGWVPSDQVDKVCDTVERVTKGRAIVEVRGAKRSEIEHSEVPSYSTHWRFLRPFTRLVSGYGAASYDEVEPTLMFALSALLMFGLMFGDLGHGLCAFALGLAVHHRADEGSVFRDLGYVISAAGLVSAFFGTFVQGTVFGWPLTELGFRWTFAFEPVRLRGEGAGATGHVLRYMGLSVVLGIALISLGVVLNMINRLRKGDFFGAVFHRFGLVGGLFYWMAVALVAADIFWEVGHTVLGTGAVLLCVPLLVLFFREPIYRLLGGEHGEEEDEGESGFIEGFLEVWEALLTYATNTLSFLRVAALALSHAALSFTLYVLMRLVGDLPGGPVWMALIFVLGTAVILALEGLIVGIQIFRLEYYEFFTKFFRAGGRKFDPFRLTGAAPSR